MAETCCHCGRIIVLFPGDRYWTHKDPERIGYNCWPERDQTPHAEPVSSESS